MARRTRRLRVAEAEPSEVEQWAHHLKQSWLLCRELGHTWKPHTARYVPEQRAYERTLRCARCTTERRQVLDGSGHVVSSQYAHPDGYLHKGLGRVTGEGRDALRLESLTRFIDQSSSKSRASA
jgi:hypothetical protein